MSDDIYPDDIVFVHQPEVAPKHDSYPPRLAIDADGYVWRVYDDGRHWSMCPVNPDNEPIPRPVTFYYPEQSDDRRELVRSLSRDELMLLRIKTRLDELETEATALRKQIRALERLWEVRATASCSPPAPPT